MYRAPKSSRVDLSRALVYTAVAVLFMRPGIFRNIDIKQAREGGRNTSAVTLKHAVIAGVRSL